MVEREMMDQEPRGEIIKALRAFRKDVGAIPKNEKNPFFKSSYAALSDIQNAIDPILDVHGLTLHCYFKELDNGTALMMDLYHESGEQMPTSEFRIRCKQTNTKVKDDKKGTVTETEVIDNPQDAGSGVTYAVRYCITVYLGLILGDDDDGNRASGNTQRRQQSTQAAPRMPPDKPDEDKGVKGSGSANEGMNKPTSGDNIGDIKNDLMALESRKKADGASKSMIDDLKKKELGDLTFNHSVEKLIAYGDALKKMGNIEAGDLPEGLKDKSDRFGEEGGIDGEE